jgi:hypothetical protein
MTHHVTGSLLKIDKSAQQLLKSGAKSPSKHETILAVVHHRGDKGFDLVILSCEFKPVRLKGQIGIEGGRRRERRGERNERWWLLDKMKNQQTKHVDRE